MCVIDDLDTGKRGGCASRIFFSSNNVIKVVHRYRRCQLWIERAGNRVRIITSDNRLTVLKLHTRAQRKCVRLAIRGNIPLFGTKRDNFVTVIPSHQALINIMQEVDGRAIRHKRRVKRGRLCSERIAEHTRNLATSSVSAGASTEHHTG